VVGTQRHIEQVNFCEASSLSKQSGSTLRIYDVAIFWMLIVIVMIISIELKYGNIMIIRIYRNNIGLNISQNIMGWWLFAY